MLSVFLSHNHKDKPAVRQLGRRLASHGIKVWIDEAEMKVGDHIIAKVSAVISQIDYLAAFISANSIHSSWVQTELEMAMNRELNGGQVKVLVIKLDDTPLPANLYWLTTKVYCNLANPALYEDEFNRLLLTLGINVGISATLENLERFDFLDMVVLKNELFILAKLPSGTSRFKQNPDGTRYFECHTYLIRVEKTGAVHSLLFARDLCVGHGALTVSNTHVYCFINYKVTDGTYAMNGSLYAIRRKPIQIQYVKEIFTNENWGWYPMVIDENNVQHFSFDNYHRCLNNIRGEKITISEFDLLQVKHIMKHSRGWFPDEKEKVLQKITQFVVAPE